MGKRIGYTLLPILLLGACYDGGPYGYNQHYMPSDAEEPFFERAQEAVFNEVRTDPEDYQDTLISWFGAVENVEEEGANMTTRLAFRTHQERHFCFDERRESCRVTVSQASSGTFSAVIQPSSDDLQGRNRIAIGSLLRVYCSVTGEYDSEGGPLLRCEHYRHWPRGQWAHTGMRGDMRR